MDYKVIFQNEMNIDIFDVLKKLFYQIYYKVFYIKRKNVFQSWIANNSNNKKCFAQYFQVKIFW